MILQQFKLLILSLLVASLASHHLFVSMLASLCYSYKLAFVVFLSKKFSDFERICCVTSVPAATTRGKISTKKYLDFYFVSKASMFSRLTAASVGERDNGLLRCLLQVMTGDLLFLQILLPLPPKKNIFLFFFLLSH